MSNIVTTDNYTTSVKYGSVKVIEEEDVVVAVVQIVGKTKTEFAYAQIPKEHCDNEMGDILFFDVGSSELKSSIEFVIGGNSTATRLAELMCYAFTLKDKK